MWKRMYPRVYEDIKGFLSPKMLSANLASSFVFMEMAQSAGFLPTTTQCAIQVAYANLKYGVPLYFVGRELVEDLLHTVPPDDVDWLEMPLPFPGACFLLEEGSLVHPSGSPAAWMCYGRLRKGEVPTFPGFTGTPVPVGDNSFCITASVFGKPGTFDFQQAFASSTRLVKFENLEEFIENEPALESWDGTVYENADKRFAARYIRLLFNLLLVMDAEPSLVERGRPTGKRTKRGTEFWHPNFIGRGDKYERQEQCGAGTSASPRPHWRRGHWTNQPYGPGRSLRKRIRIKSLWVGGRSVLAKGHAHGK